MMAAVGLSSGHSQQAQNQLDYLDRYGLIVRDDMGQERPIFDGRAMSA
jgi:hypothetical protein